MYQDLHLHLDFQNEVVRLDFKPVKLTPKEYELLAALVRNAGEVLPRQTLLMRVWGYGSGIRTRTLDVHIRRLRGKLERCSHRYIETIFGVGYRFQPHLGSDVKLQNVPVLNHMGSLDHEALAAA